jgi:hypothetical protein|tara:strand:+ start:980 stop:1249 length:270 start_codon:yes stop_codon:yes gene_type:complete
MRPDGIVISKTPIHTPSNQFNMTQNDDLKKRRANVLRVQATNRLSGRRVSNSMAASIEKYAKGEISLAELLIEAKMLHGAHKLSTPPAP